MGGDTGGLERQLEIIKEGCTTLNLPRGQSSGEGAMRIPFSGPVEFVHGRKPRVCIMQTVELGKWFRFFR